MNQFESEGPDVAEIGVALGIILAIILISYSVAC